MVPLQVKIFGLIHQQGIHLMLVMILIMKVLLPKGL